jgi:hypothetical protein
MGHRRNVSDIAYLQTTAVQRTDSRFTTWSRTVDFNVKILETIKLYCSFASALGSDLRGEWGALARTAEA